jgi:hypothetical protein
MAKQEPTVETVTMTDGALVEFTGKKKLVKATTISPEGAVTVRLDFRNGEFRTFTVPPALMARFAGHGAEQKLGDSMAGLEKIDDAIIAVDDLIDRLYNGEWNARREASGFSGASILVKALCESTGQTPEKVKAFLTTKTQAQKLAMRGSDRLKPIIQRLEAEEAARKTGGEPVDQDALFAGLEPA